MCILNEELKKMGKKFLVYDKPTIADLQIFYELTDFISMQMKWE